MFYTYMLKVNLKMGTVITHGSTNCGKTEILEMLNKIFYCYNMRQMVGQFSLEENADINRKLIESGLEP